MRTLDIHGKIVSEAQISIEAFIQEGFNHRQYFILIIHGNGKYILRELVVNICSESKFVERQELAPPNLGGAGATLIYLKKRGIDGQIISS